MKTTLDGVVFCCRTCQVMQKRSFTAGGFSPDRGKGEETACAIRANPAEPGRWGGRTRRQNRAAEQSGRTERQDGAAGRSGRTERQDGAAEQGGKTDRQDGSARRIGKTERQDGAARRIGKTERQDGAARRSGRTERQDGAAGRSGKTERQDGAAGRSGRTERQDGAAGRGGRKRGGGQSRVIAADRSGGAARTNKKRARPSVPPVLAPGFQPPGAAGQRKSARRSGPASAKGQRTGSQYAVRTPGRVQYYPYGRR